MALFNGFTFDGVNSLDYGIYITGEGVYNAPERAVEMVEIQGRNGALAIDQGRWDNIEVTYHCGCFGANQADFAEKIGRFRNAICSRTSYFRLTDDYHPDEYRLALYHAGVEVDHVRRAGEFDLIFDCKPQRFLISGEDTITVGDWGDVTEYSGDIVSFEGDEMTAIKSLSVSLSPIQNLNGYDHPWVGGAEKNKYPILIGADTFTNNGGATHSNADGALKITCSATSANEGVHGSSTSTFTVAVRETGFPCIVSFDIWSTGSAAVALRMFNNLKTLTVTATKQRVSIAIPTDATAGYFNCYANMFSGDIYIANMQIESGSTASAYEPYENICPITGWDGVSVTRAGKNLLDAHIVDNSRGLTFTKDADGGIHVVGTPTGTWVNFSNVYNVDIPAGEYTFSIQSEIPCNLVLYAYYKGDTAMGTNSIVAGAKSKAVSFSKRVDRIFVGVTQLNTSILYDFTVYPQLELGTTATAYEPYNGTTYTQEFKDERGNTLTVYGGEDEIVGGVLTVTRKMLIADGTQPVIASQVNQFYINVSEAKRVGASNQTTYAGVMCDRLPSKTWAGLASEGGIGCAPVWGTGIGFKNPDITTAADWKTYFTNNPTQFSYELATPITYTLTPQQVETLIGTNNIWSDAGEVTVEVADDPNKIVNPTLYDAKPLIKVSGYGTVQVGSVTITIEGSASDVTYIDCDSMECYRLNGLAIVSANSAVSFSSYDFPMLEADTITGMSYSTNISQVQIVPRWWQL